MGLQGAQQFLKLGVLGQEGLAIIIHEQHEEQWSQVEIRCGQHVAYQPRPTGLSLENTKHFTDGFLSDFICDLITLSLRPNKAKEPITHNGTICVGPDTADETINAGSIDGIGGKEGRVSDFVCPTNDRRGLVESRVCERGNLTERVPT
jgi:hypothetical protein